MKSYPNNKDSGVEWIRSIPSNWEVKPIFAEANKRKDINTDGFETNVLSLSYGNIIKRNVENNFGLLPASFNTYQIVDKGNIILRLTDLQNDKKSLRVGLVKEMGIITSAYLCLELHENLNSKFAYYLLHSYDISKVFYYMGCGVRQTLTFQDFKRLPILLPSIKEQQQIVSYLDHKTQQIDTLIEKKQRLIDLLKEERTAVINEGVTKGIAPDVPMKSSGIEWLGDIPKHWNLVKGKYLFQILSGYAPNDVELNKNGSHYYFKVNDLNYLEDNLYLSDGSHKIDIEPNKLYEREIILFPKRGAAIFTNKLCITTQECAFDTNLMGLRVNKIKILPKFLSYYLLWRRLDDIADTSTIPQINNKHIDPLKIPLPNVEEQNSIIQHIDKETTRIDTILGNAEKEIKLLKEYRTALISEVVTGKIDVRDWE